MGNIRTVIPLAEFKEKIEHWIAYLNEGADPLLVTRRGRGAFVVQSVDSYAKMSDLALEGQHQLALQATLAEMEEAPIEPPRLSKLSR